MPTRFVSPSRYIQCDAAFFVLIPCGLKKSKLLFLIFSAICFSNLCIGAQASDSEFSSKQPFSGLTDQPAAMFAMDPRENDALPWVDTEVSTIASICAPRFPGGCGPHCPVQRFEFAGGLVALGRRTRDMLASESDIISDTTKRVGQEVVEQLKCTLEENNGTPYPRIVETLDEIRASNHALRSEIRDELNATKDEMIQKMNSLTQTILLELRHTKLENALLRNQIQQSSLCNQKEVEQTVFSIPTREERIKASYEKERIESQASRSITLDSE